MVPSPTQPVPVDGSYLSGGYVVREYGSKGGGKVDAIQIEIPNSKRDRDSKLNKDSSSDEDEQAKYLNELAEAVVEYINMNYEKKGVAPMGPEW